MALRNLHPIEHAVVPKHLVIKKPEKSTAAGSPQLSPQLPDRKPPDCSLGAESQCKTDEQAPAIALDTSDSLEAEKHQCHDSKGSVGNASSVDASSPLEILDHETDGAATSHEVSEKLW